MRGQVATSNDIVPMMKLLAALAALLLAAPQDAATPKPAAARGDGLDHIILTDRSEVRGAILSIDASGALEVRVKDGDRVIRLGVEETARIQFGSEDPVQIDPQGQQLRLYHGGSVSGKLKSFDGSTAVLETTSGPFRLRRQDVKLIVLAPLGGPLPEIKEEKRDILIRVVEKKEEGREKPVQTLVADYGRLLSIGDQVQFHVVPVKKEGEEAPAGKEEDVEYPRAAVRQVYLQRDEAAPDLPPGWFSKVLLKNGDKLVGVLQGFSSDKVRIFSHLFGAAEIEKKNIHSISFVQHARMSVGNILICDQNGIREFDRAGRELWTYANNTQYSWSARKLENGNVLIANTNFNQVIEVKPSGKTGGEIVWRMEQSNYPYDAIRLDNGNTLVAEYYSNRVVEYESKTKNAVWQAAINYPISVQRLENGNTLVCSNYQVVELDREGKQKWQASLQGVRPWRAQRLESGNTLITDYQRGQVVEIDADSKVVWKKASLSRPVQAIRLEDGNILILEQGANRLIEIDPSNPNKSVTIVPGLNYPQGMSTY
jgi:hypothetical protein